MRNAIRALAVARLTNLVVEDKITEPLRMPVLQWGAGQKEGSFKWAVAYLIDCKKCSSVWSAAVVLLADSNRYTRPLVTVLAGSQAALTLLSVNDRLERY